MINKCDRICFNDKLLMLFAIPILSFIIPIVFFGCRFDRYPYFTLENYWITLIITTVVWKSIRLTLIWYRQKYPNFIDVRKRLTIQSVVMLVVAVCGNTLIQFILYKTIFKYHKASMWSADEIIKSNSAAVFCTITIIAIYESIYFMHQLKHSVEEKENLKRENLKAQLDALKTQVNPHFLFNNLNTLTSLIPENTGQAVKFVQQLSKVYRYILEVKDNKTIPLSDELDVVNAYSFLLKTRFENNLKIEINIPKEKMHKKIVPLSLQLLIENAIKHNIVSSEKPLHINIFSSNGSVVVDNNLQMKKQIMESTGIGLDNIRNRYKLLSNQKVEIVHTENTFTVSIPLLEN
jgi:two-component system, LytTR family, sensor kinase